MGIPSENENESMEEVCVINRQPMYPEKHDQKEKKTKKDDVYI